MTHSKLMKITYNNIPSEGGTFTTCALFSAHSEAELDLQIRRHTERYGAILELEIDQSDIEFEDLAE